MAIFMSSHTKPTLNSLTIRYFRYKFLNLTDINYFIFWCCKIRIYQFQI